MRFGGLRMDCMSFIDGDTLEGVHWGMFVGTVSDCILMN